MRSISKLTWIGLCLALLTGWALGQSFLGTITGDAVDSSGAVVPDAKVELTEVATNVKRTATTNAEGRYLFPSLTPGTYVVTIGKTGFKDVKSSSILLTAQQNSRFDARLEVGEGAQTIEVMATPPTLNTENATLSNITPREDLLNMPLDRRSTLEYLFMSSSNTNGDGSSYMIGGLRGTYTNFTIDGVSSNASLWGGQSGPMTEESFEAISDLKVLSSNNSAEFPSVATLIISTRSGQNTPHGSLFLTEHQYALDAKCFFCGPNPKGPERHQLGGSFGGPVYIPKIYDGRNKTFFYFTWDATIFPAGGGLWANQTSVPTLAFKQGDFSKLGQTIIDPTTGQPFPGNLIPSNRISSVSQKLQQIGFLDPNTGSPDSFVNNWQGQEGEPENLNRWVTRIDHNIGDHDKITARASIFNDNMKLVHDGALPIYNRHQTRNTRQAFLQETHTFGTNMVNDFTVGFNRDRSLIGGGHNGTQVVQQIGLEGLTANGTNLKGFPKVNFNNFAQMGEYPTYMYMSEGWEFSDNVTWQKGKHSIKGGGLLRALTPAISDWQDDFGTFTFNGFATGFDYADFLLGIPQDTARVSRAPDRYNRYKNLGLYLQDAWAATPKLTLTLGLRWEYAQPPYEKNDMRFAFDPKTGNLVVPNEKSLALISPLYPKAIPIFTAQQVGFPGGRSLVNGDWKNFGPRVSFAYRLTNKTVVRGGYALFYAPLISPLLDRFSSGPYGTQERFYNSFTNGVPRLQFPNPFAGNPDDVPQAGSQVVGGTDPNIKTPRTQQWNFTVERELGHSTVVRATYRGSMSNQIPYTRDLNIPMASTDPNNVNWYRYPNFSSVTWSEDGGIHKLNALDLGFERKFTSGLTFQAGYTLTKSLSDVGNDGEDGSPENPYNRSRDLGNVQFTPRQRFTANTLWEIPFGTGKRFGTNLPKVANAFIGDWQVTAVNVMSTGQFLTPSFSGVDITNTRNTATRPDLVGDWKVSNQSITNWFNAGAFAVPAPGMYGNSPRGLIVGPGLFNFDLGLHKFFRLREGMKLQIFAKAANVFNHPNFDNPEMNISSAGVGQISWIQGSRYDTLGARARSIRVGFRFDF